MTLRIEIVPDYDAMSRSAAVIVADTVKSKPGTAISLPTGSTPVGMFNELIAMVERGELRFEQTQLFCLDEYVGVTADDPNSLTNWLYDNFLTASQIPAAGGSFTDAWDNRFRYNKPVPRNEGGVVVSVDPDTHRRVLAAIRPELPER